MKNLILAIALLAPGMSAYTQEPTAQTPQTAPNVTPVEGGFSRFEYQGFSFMVPSGASISETDKEALVKCADGTFGMSVKVENDKKASAKSALEMCRRMVTELDVRGAKITKMLIHGMQGAKLEGMTEGIPVSVLILAVDGKYVKTVVINTPAHADWTNITLDSITRLP